MWHFTYIKDKSREKKDNMKYIKNTVEYKQLTQVYSMCTEERDKTHNLRILEKFTNGRVQD